MYRYIKLLLPFTIMFVLSQSENDSESKIRCKRMLSVDHDTFKRQCLEQHNMYRSWHKAPALVIDEKLNQFAQGYAEKLASEDHPVLKHSTSPYGENLYYYRRPMDGRRCVDKWYAEYQFYNYDDDSPKNLSVVGHFTQLVWDESRKLGIGIATSISGRTYVCCSYWPRGNIRNKYRKHVHPVSRGPLAWPFLGK